MDPQEIYDNFHQAAGPDALTEAQQGADGLAQSYPEHARDVQALVDAMRSGWTGEAADAASQSLNPLIVNFHEGGQDLGTAQDLVARQVESWHAAKNAVQPMPPTPAVQDPLIGSARQNFVSQVQNYTSAAQSNVDAMGVYSDASTYNTDNLPPFDPALQPPGGTVNVRPPTAPGSGGSGARAGSVSGVPGGGSRPLAPALRSQPGPTGSMPSNDAHGIATAGRPSATSPTAVAGPTNASSAVTAATTPASPLPGHGAALPPDVGSGRDAGGVPGGERASGAGLWRASTGESPGDPPRTVGSGGQVEGQGTPRGGFRGGPPGRPAGWGEDGDPSAPGAGSRSGAGTAAIDEPERGFAPTPPASERAVSTTPGMMPGRSGGDESEDQHTNKYVHGDPRELFAGDLTPVAPPTIGQPPLPPPQQDR